MKKKILLLSVILFIWALPCSGSARQKAEFADPVFTFDPVPEGVHVTHTFMVRNAGDTVLKIEKVSPP